MRARESESEVQNRGVWTHINIIIHHEVLKVYQSLRTCNFHQSSRTFNFHQSSRTCKFHQSLRPYYLALTGLGACRTDGQTLCLECRVFSSQQDFQNWEPSSSNISLKSCKRTQWSWRELHDIELKQIIRSWYWNPTEYVTWNTACRLPGVALEEAPQAPWSDIIEQRHCNQFVTLPL